MMSRSPATDEMLRAVLEPQLRSSLATSVRISRIERKPFAYATSCAIEELEVHIDRMDPVRMLFKDLAVGSGVGSSARSRPDFMYDPSREIAMYRDVLDPTELGTAVPFAWVLDDDASRHWLFLEHVRGDLLWQIGDLESWKEAARWLGRFHRHPALQRRAATVQLLHRDAAHHRRWLQRARQLRPHEPAMSSIAAAYELALTRLGRLPITLVHGEFYPSNIVVRREQDPHVICPVDWELAGLAPGVMDLAALVSGWEEAQEVLLIEAYREGLELRGAAPSIEDLTRSVWCSRLIQCVQWIGWSDTWTPPAEHAQDWLSEAISLSDRLTS